MSAGDWQQKLARLGLKSREQQRPSASRSGFSLLLLQGGFKPANLKTSSGHDLVTSLPASGGRSETEINFNAESFLLLKPISFRFAGLRLARDLGSRFSLSLDYRNLGRMEYILHASDSQLTYQDEEFGDVRANFYGISQYYSINILQLGLNWKHRFSALGAAGHNLEFGVACGPSWNYYKNPEPGIRKPIGTWAAKAHLAFDWALGNTVFTGLSVEYHLLSTSFPGVDYTGQLYFQSKENWRLKIDRPYELNSPARRTTVRGLFLGYRIGLRF